MWFLGDHNQVADFLSCSKPLPGEWRLHPEVVYIVWQMFVRAEVDLFAFWELTHCPLWFYWTDGDAPLGQDALAHRWPNALLYEFLPLPLILTVFHQALFWEVWVSTAGEAFLGLSWRLPDRRDLLSQLTGQVWHPTPVVSNFGSGRCKAPPTLNGVHQVR